MRQVAVLGATGSIGESTLDVIARHPDRYRATVLAAHRSVDEMASLCRAHQPLHAVMSDPDAAAALADRLSDLPATQVVSGAESLDDLVADGAVDSVVAGIVGFAGLRPTLSAARAGKTILLANKEALVVAGHIVMPALTRTGAEILPVDSEHNAIFQVWSDRHVKAIRSIVLTASGGPFLNTPMTEFPQITAAQALRHPRWSMGRKISIDSATMMNKGLEIIEACVLFDLPEDKVEVKVHPQSVVHGMISYDDGSVVAQLGPADMRVPLSYVLAWPDRLPWLAEDIRPADEPLLDFSKVLRRKVQCSKA